MMMKMKKEVVGAFMILGMKKKVLKMMMKMWAVEGVIFYMYI